MKPQTLPLFLFFLQACLGIDSSALTKNLFGQEENKIPTTFSLYAKFKFLVRVAERFRVILSDSSSRWTGEETASLWATIERGLDFWPHGKLFNITWASPISPIHKTATQQPASSELELFSYNVARLDECIYNYWNIDMCIMLLICVALEGITKDLSLDENLNQ